VILVGAGREVAGAAGGHLINLPALPDRVLREVLQALGFSWVSVRCADAQLYLSRCSDRARANALIFSRSISRPTAATE
jgi:hypothetical protein